MLKYFLLLVLLYFFFILAPALSFFFSIFFLHFDFGKKRDSELAKSYYRPYRARLEAAMEFLEQQRPVMIMQRTADGITLAAEWYDQGADRTVIFLHGFRSNPRISLGVEAETMYRQGFNLLIPHQRAHGESGGRTTGLGLKEREDLLQWLTLVQQKHPEGRILLWGISMGSSIASYASDKLTDGPVKAMILDCGFISPGGQIIGDCTKRHMPKPLLMPIIQDCARWVLGLELSTATTESLKNSRIPTLFLHGTQDQTVPIACGRANYEACGAEKEFLAVEGAAHTVSYLAGGEAVRQQVHAFIQKYMSEKGTENDETLCNHGGCHL